MVSSRSANASDISPEFVVLGLLLQHAAHGYELHKRLADDLGQIWHISLSQTYSILTRLEQRHFITGATQKQARLPNRRLFEITPEGHQHFDRWLRTPTGSSSRAIRVEFTTRLYFAQTLQPALLGPLINDQMAEVQHKLAALQQALQDLPAEQTFNRLGVSLRVRQLISVLDWLAECRQTLVRDGAGKPV